MKETDFVMFEKVAEPMINWIKEHGNIHMKIIVDCEKAEILQGEASVIRRGKHEAYNPDGKW